MTTSGVDTLTTVARRDSGALAWDGSHFVAAHGTSSTAATATFWDTTGTITGTLALSGWNISQSGLIDGLDFDHGEIWISPDIASVWRRDGTTGAVIGPDPWKNLGGAGNMSGVERVDVGGNTYIIVVNDVTTPRSLGIYHLDGTEVGTVQLTNSRYEDLAFDGRYLWAADYFGNSIDKIDLLVDGGSILQVTGVPTPAALPAGLALLSLLGLGGWLRHRRTSTSS